MGYLYLFLPKWCNHCNNHYVNNHYVLNKKRFQNIINQQQHTHTRLTAFVRDYPGDPVPER